MARRREVAPEMVMLSPTWRRAGASGTATAENTRRAATGMAFAIAGVGLGKMGLAVACEGRWGAGTEKGC
ncbi:hypothetical protein U1Q18_002099 [Sarracenia purpurea var. burkii]